MSKLKKFNLIICGFLLAFTGLFFVGCGAPDTSNVSLTSSAGQYLELEVGESESIMFTLENFASGMDDTLDLSIESETTQGSITFEAGDPQNGRTIVDIHAVKGGTSILRASYNGQKDCLVKIRVLRAPNSIYNDSRNLYVSQTTMLERLSSYFSFEDTDEEITQGELSFYFYGKLTNGLNAQELTPDDVKEEVSGVFDFINEFYGVRLYQDLESQNQYLLFYTDEGIFTLADNDLPDNYNRRFMFISAENANGDIELPSRAKAVVMGEEFAFLAVSDYNENAFASRTFVTLADIVKPTFEYYYPVKDSYPPQVGIEEGELLNQQGIVLVPNRTDANDVEFKRAIVSLQNFDLAALGENVSITAETDNPDIAVVLPVEGESSGVFSIESRVPIFSENKSANITIKIFYNGFEDVDDPSVNFVFNIPVSVKFEPESISINMSELTFYNDYYETYGWKELYISRNPQKSDFEYLQVTYDPRSVDVSYTGYFKEVESDNPNLRVIQVQDLTIPIRVRGFVGAIAPQEGEIGLKLFYTDIIGVNNFKEFVVNYTIKQGPGEPKFYSQYSRLNTEEEAAYIDLNSDAITFDALYTEAEFEGLSFRYTPQSEDESDVVRLYEGDKPLVADGNGNYRLNIMVSPQHLGRGTYTIMLDNGYSRRVTFQVVETLKNTDIYQGLSISNSSSSTRIEVEKGEDNFNPDTNNAQHIYNTIYIQNAKEDFGEEARIRLIANGNLASTALRQVISTRQADELYGMFFDISGRSVALGDGGYYEMIITTNGNGVGTLRFVVTSNQVGVQGDKFNISPREYYYTVRIISYSLVKRLNVYKLHDGEGSYSANAPASSVTIYNGAVSSSQRTATFDVASAGEGFIFYNYDEDRQAFVENLREFSKDYVYWTASNASVTLNNESVIYMIGDHTYEIGNLGTFNPSTRTFVAYPNANIQDLKLLANLRQKNRTFSYTITIRGQRYTAVNGISLNPAVDEESGIVMSNTESGMIKPFEVSYFPSNATNAVLDYQFVPDNEDSYIFGRDNEGITFEPNGEGSYMLRLDCSAFSQTPNAMSENKISGTLHIFAIDWLDASGNLTQELTLQVNFANGTWANPIYLESANDVLLIKENYHYRLSASIDVSALSSSLPLNFEFSGSIIGTNNYAQITGINITSGVNDNGVSYYGLFKGIAGDGLIENVRFSGQINITQAPNNSKIGLLAGENNGTLRNISAVILRDSEVRVSGTANVGVLVGENLGQIVLDHSVFGNIKNYGNYSVDYTSIYPNAMVYMEDNFLSVRMDDASANVAVGGVCGINRKDIIKIDASGLKLYGYSAYFAFANIDVSVPDGVGYEDVANSFVGAVAGRSISGSNIYCDVSNFAAGKGIVVGGRLTGPQYVGGVVGRFEGDKLNGITSRTYVRGFKPLAEVTIGAISGYFLGNTNYRDFAVEAVDDDQAGIESSMIILRLVNNSDSPTLDDYYNTVSFGSQITNRYTELGGQKIIKVSTFVTREQSQQEQFNQNEKNLYYGDYIIVSNNSILNRLFFDKNTDKDWNINANNPDNGGNGNFTNMKEEVGGREANIFYAFYFKASGYVEGAEETSNIATAQRLLNLRFNTLSPTSSLYPLIMSEGLVFTSLDQHILTIGSSGQITINQTGLAELRVSSILNKREVITVYIYVTNYFNNDGDIDIIYSTAIQDQPIKSGSKIELKGNNQAQYIVRPDYTLKEDGRELINSDGALTLNYVNMNLEANTEIYPFAVAEVENALRIEVNGQMLTIARGPDIAERDYSLSLGARLSTDVRGISYYVPVNRQLQSGGVSVTYTKGAERIEFTTFDSISIKTTGEGENFIVVDSQSVEAEPYYTITTTDGGDEKIIQSTRFSGDYSSTQLFNVNFERISNSGAIGEQKFLLKVSVDKTSKVYQDRHNVNIYGTYYITIYAQTDTSKTATIPLILGHVNASEINIDNYPRYEELDLNDVNTISSDRAYPGKKGLLMINVRPEDAEFDYIEITNDESNYAAGDGWASFSLVAKLAKSSGDGRLFAEEYISGSTLPDNNGFRLKYSDLTEIYDEKKDDDNINLYEKYKGIVYINYLIGSSGVIEGSNSRFKVTVYKDGSAIKEKTITLVNELTYHADISIVGKQSISPESFIEDGHLVYAEYNVARGLRYQLNLDYYGFAPNKIQVDLIYKDSMLPVPNENNRLARVVEEGGSYYLEILDDIDYSSYSDGYPLLIRTTAHYEDDAELQPLVSYTRINILEYVVNYSYSEGENEDIVDEMQQGVISVELGNRQTLQIDMIDFIEFDRNNPIVLNEIRAFMDELTARGRWQAYTNLNEAGIPSGNPITTKNAVTSFILDQDNPQNNMYFRNDGIVISPLSVHNYRNQYYMFSYEGGFRIGDNGVYVFSDDDRSVRVYTEFVFNVFPSSSLEHPRPVQTYDDLMSMDLYPNGHFILMNDIEIRNTSENPFMPINAQFASFDGNGHTISFNGVYSINGASGSDVANTNVGLFATINTGAIVENLNIALTGETVFSVSASGVHLGLLAGQNNGIITNCYAYSGSIGNNSFSLSLRTTQSTSTSYVAGLVGQNGGSGTITNSRSAVTITSNYSVAGLVGINSGKIASCYYMGGSLTNLKSTTSTHYMGGLVVMNSGQIITSYVSGARSRTKPYSTERFLSSNTIVGGFAYSNTGTISDCYSNISILGNVQRAGFVFTNGGAIKNSFSLSIINATVVLSYGFSANNLNENGEAVGTFENCFFLRHERTGPDDEHGNINVNLSDDPEGITPLDISDFALDNTNTEHFENIFSHFAYSTSISTNAVWFYSNGGSTSDFNNAVFSAGRLELVAPNIIAFSQKEISEVVTDETTGEDTFSYLPTRGSEAVGSIKNPYIAYDAESFETYMLAPKSITGFNYRHYRLVADIDYSQYNDNQLSQLYTVSLAGSLEGNGMEVRNIRLSSQSAHTNAGLFAQVGLNLNNVGVVMNMTLSPDVVSFTNTNCVGAVTGLLSYGYIYNVDVNNGEAGEYSDAGSEVAINARNFAGGVVGRTMDYYEIKNVTSNISAVASYRPFASGSTDDENFSFSSNSANLSTYSYAGSIVGFAGGNGVIVNLNSTGVRHVNADRVGVAIGGIENSAKIKDVVVNISPNLQIMAYKYGGLAIGENKGKVENIRVLGDADSRLIFTTTLPEAIGGVVGLLSGGEINGAYVNQYLRAVAQLTNYEVTTVRYIGGIAGKVRNNSKINRALVSQDISASANYIGGIVGYAIDGSLILDQVAVAADNLAILDRIGMEGTSSRIARATLGGLIGEVTSNMTTTITNSYSYASLTIDTHVYSSSASAFVGSFVGWGTPFAMRDCFATGSILAQTQDLRSESGAQTLGRMVRQPEAEVYYDQNAMLASGGYAISYQQNVKAYERVYFYGNAIGTGTDISLNANTSALSFRANYFNRPISFGYNALGTASNQTGFNSNNANIAESVTYPFNSDYYYFNEAGASPDGMPPFVMNRFIRYDSANRQWVGVNFDFTEQDAEYFKASLVDRYVGSDGRIYYMFTFGALNQQYIYDVIGNQLNEYEEGMLEGATKSWVWTTIDGRVALAFEKEFI